MMKNKPGKGSLVTGLIGIGVAIFGIIWTFEAYSITKDSPFGSQPSIILIAAGILFVVIAILGAIRGFRNGSEEDRNEENLTGREAEENLVNRITQAVKENQMPREKSKWNCPYCGTAVHEDEAFCPACGWQASCR